MWTLEQPAPAIGEVLRRRDDGRFATVEHIAALGIPNFSTWSPLYVGDVVMRERPGVCMVTTGGAYFWSRWERVDTTRWAQLARTCLGAPDS